VRRIELDSGWRTALLAFAAIMTLPLSAAGAAEPPTESTVLVRTFPASADDPPRQIPFTGAPSKDGHFSTGPASSLEVLFPDGGRLCLGPQSSLSLDSSGLTGGGQGTVRVLFASGFFRIVPGVPPHPTYAISTPQGEVDPGQADLYCAVSNDAGGIACFARTGTAKIRYKGAPFSVIPQGNFWSGGLLRTAAAGSTVPLIDPISRADFDAKMHWLDDLNDCGLSTGGLGNPGAQNSGQQSFGLHDTVPPDPSHYASPTQP
jgi:hypothetical protein